MTVSNYPVIIVPNMAKPIPSIPKVKFSIWIPEDVRLRLDLMFMSEATGKVPHGAFSSFFASRLREMLDWETLDLHPYGMPEGMVVKGSEHAIKVLREVLEATGE